MEKRFSVAIVEDDDSAAKRLEVALKKFGAESGVSFGVKRFYDGESFISSYDKGFDIIYMDIELPGMNGMTTVKKLRELDENVTLIFVTNLAQYAIDGYQYGAFDFIVKPVTYFAFKVKIERALRRIKTRTSVELWINVTGQGRRQLSSGKIKYIDVNKHDVTYHTTEGDFTTRNGTLKGLQDELIGLPFASPMQCYLVNLRYVTGVEKKDVVVGKYRLGISSAKRKAFLTALSDYLGKGYLSGTEEDYD